MQLKESFDLPFARPLVWKAFEDIALVVQCLPGARLTSPADQRPLELAFEVKMGPIAAAFAGQGEVAYDADRFSGSFTGQGVDRKNNSRVKGQADFSLLASGDACTTVEVTVDFSLTGALAQFGRSGIVKEIASSITAQFAANLKGCMVPPVPSESAAPVAAQGSHSPSSTQETPQPATQPSPQPATQPSTQLNLGRLLWQLFVQRLRRLFGGG